MLLKIIYTRFFLPGIICFIGCGGSTDVDNTIEAPIPVVKTADSAAFESGIRAWPLPNSDSMGIRLEWHSIASVPVGGYVIYRGEQIDTSKNVLDLTKIATVEMNQTPEDTVFVDESARTNTKYFYKIAAFERSGAKSEGKKSETLEFTLGSSLHLLTPKNGEAVEDSIPVFRWAVSNSGAGYSVIRVYEANPVNNALRSPVWIYAGYPSFSDPAFIYNIDGNALPLQPGKTYRWNVTQVIPGRKNYGSVSNYFNFTVR